MRANQIADDHTLVETLRLAVPLHIMDVAGLTPAQRQAVANRCAATVGGRGDTLLFKGRTAAGRRSTGEAFNSLARGLACLAYLPGGVAIAGLHWCVPLHPGGAEGVEECIGGVQPE